MLDESDIYNYGYSSLPSDGTIRLRCTLMATHADEHLHSIAEAFDGKFYIESSFSNHATNHSVHSFLF